MAAKRRSESTLRRAVRVLVRDFDNEVFDDVRDAAQAADELLKEIPASAMHDEREALQRIVREALQVVRGTETPARRAPKTTAKTKTKTKTKAKTTAKKRVRAPRPWEPHGRALMDALLAGSDVRPALRAASVLRGIEKDVYLGQVTTILMALAADDRGAWAKAQLRQWGPSEVAFNEADLARWNAPVFRRAFLGALPELAQLVAELPQPSFQVREDLMRATFTLIARHGDPDALRARTFQRALSRWIDRWAIFRLAEWLAHRTTTTKGREHDAYARMEEALRPLAPTEKTSKRKAR